MECSSSGPVTTNHQQTIGYVKVIKADGKRYAGYRNLDGVYPITNVHRLWLNDRIFVCAISVTRLLINIQLGVQLATLYNDETFCFRTNIELSLAVVSACLPTLRTIYTKLRPPKLRAGYTYGYNKKESKGSSGLYSTGRREAATSSPGNFGPPSSVEDDLDNIPMVDRPAGPGRSVQPTNGIRVEHRVDTEAAHRLLV